jgi:hypothetical protein
MATLQQRGKSFRILFVWHGKRHAFTIGKVDPSEAVAKVSQVDYLLMRLQQRLLTLPNGCAIETFLQFDGQPPVVVANGPSESKPEWLLSSFTDRYLETNAQSLELSTVSGIRRHFKHLTRTYGERYPIAELTLADLQRHVDRRAKDRYRKRPINAAHDFQGNRLPPHGLELGSLDAIPLGPISRSRPALSEGRRKTAVYDSRRNPPPNRIGREGQRVLAQPIPHHC